MITELQRNIIRKYETEVGEKEKVRKEQRRENSEQRNCTKWHVDLFHFHRGPQKTNQRSEGRVEEEQMRRRPGGKKERVRDEGSCSNTRGEKHNIHVRDVWPLESELERDGSEWADTHVTAAHLNQHYDTASEGMREQMTCAWALSKHTRASLSGR